MKWAATKLVAAIAASALVLGTATMAVAAPDGLTKAADLFAGQSTDVGDVFVWNDATDLYVEIDIAAPWCMSASQVAVGDVLADIPMANGNPVPGKFPAGDTYSPCVTSDTFSFPLTGLGTNPYIAVHAKVWDTSSKTALWIYSDNGNTWVTATSALPAGKTLPFLSTDAWEAFGDPADPTPSTWDLGVGAGTFQHADWIWQSYRVQTPTVDETVTFTRSFVVPGLVLPTSWLKVTTDDAFTAMLNGTTVASGSWPNWPTVQTASPFSPVMGANTLVFTATNSNLSNGAAGTIDNNPGGLIYEAKVKYYAHGESAWAGTQLFPGKNWATYFRNAVDDYVFGDTTASTPYGTVNLDFEVFGDVGTTSWARITGSVNDWEGPVVDANVSSQTAASFTVRVASGTPAGMDQCDISIAVTEGGAGVGTWDITSVASSPGETCPFVGQIQGPYTISGGSIVVVNN